MRSRRRTVSWILGTALCLAALPYAGNRTAAGTEDAAATLPAYRGTLLVQLAVGDLDRAIDFYTRVMGFQLELRDESLRWARIKIGIDRLTLGLGEAPDPKGSGSMSLNVGVRDIEEARRLLEAKGVRFRGPTITVPGVVKLADFEDPDGNRIRLAEDMKER